MDNAQVAWVLDLLPDWGWRLGFEALRDFLSVGIAGLGAYLAYLAISLGREQTRIGREQVEIAKRQEALDLEQARITKRQGEIAELQHQMIANQLRVRAVLRVSAVFHDDADGTGRYGFQLANDGNTTANDLRYELETPEGLRQRIGLDFATTGRTTNSLTSLHERDGVVVFSQNLVGGLRPGESVKVLEIARIESLTLKDVPIRWRAFSSAGAFPQSGEFTPLHIDWLIEHRDYTAAEKAGTHRASQ